MRTHTPSRRTRFATALAGALAAVAFLPAMASAAPSEEPPDQTLRGRGLAVCPVDAYCLYEFENFNRDSARGGAVWAYFGTVYRMDEAADDRASSAFNNTHKAVHLYEDGDFRGRCADLQAFSGEPRMKELALDERVSSVATREQMACR
ncbi:hypothetical protein SALBM135S_08471 [Streptomyces alboniger]